MPSLLARQLPQVGIPWTTHPFSRQLAKTTQAMFQIDEERALLALDGNRHLLMELAIMFREDVPQILQELNAAIGNENATRTQSAVHSLKGLASTFYAKPTVDLAQRLEDSAAHGKLEIFREGELEKLEKSIQSVIQEFVERGWVAETKSEP